MLTMPLWPDIGPCHTRQVYVLNRSTWADWLDPTVSAKDILRPLPAGTLLVEPAVEVPPEKAPPVDPALIKQPILFDLGGRPS